eukprot:gnl/TRDRNA2_/TRDRNA2_179273_c0_seq1.p1 gnl/TRDRNA2_/TRDRNA2_179273_c0~~gnl/TRDRNA2_/TRDRNA2_179273_c0_seq1.p1  ORF type:complete len:317 (-),score=83.94 gnl/TRDRNA2_/TRDRNA2_179273_c0_seq1:234-1184(-)
MLQRPSGRSAMLPMRSLLAVWTVAAFALAAGSVVGHGAAKAAKSSAKGAINVAGDADSADTQAYSVASNKLINNYRKYTLQYEKDAVEAEKAAKIYSLMAKQAVKQSKAMTKQISTAEFARVGIPLWAHAAWQFEEMITDPRPAKGAAAAAKAAAPYAKAYGDYVKAQNSYDAAAQAYGNRVGMDSSQAKLLQTYANQYRLQGNTELADAYQEQATTLMKQAEAFKGIALDYNTMAAKIFGVLPSIQDMAGVAGTRAEWMENPTGAFGPEQAVPFTPVPPLEFVQEREQTQTMRHGFATFPKVAAHEPGKESLLRR